MTTRRFFLQSSAGAAAALASGLRVARAAAAPGVSDTEIKIGQTMPYSGPASGLGAIGRANVAYFKMINELGGVNGRKVNLLSVDDAYSPPKTVEQTRRLVEQEEVAFIFGSVGTAQNAATRAYLNERKIPQLFINSGSSLFTDPQRSPWTMSLNVAYQTEARIFAKAALKMNPDAKIGVLYQNDGFGKDYLAGLKDGLGAEHAASLVKEASYETSQPSVDSEVLTLQAAGCDVFLIAATPKFAAQAIRKASDIGWAPVRYITYVANSVVGVMKLAGFEKSKGVVSGQVVKDPTDSRWKDDRGVKDYGAFVANYMTSADFADALTVVGYWNGMTMLHVLKQCGDDLSRENVMRQATNIKDLEIPLLLPGIKINTSPDNYRPIHQFQLERFNGESWEGFGDILEG